MVYGSIGSVSSATHRLEDLIPAYRDALVRLAEKAKQLEQLDMIAAINAKLQKADEDDEDNYFESEDATFDLEGLTEALESYAPPFCYFGAHQGDGADFGFWWDQEAFDRGVSDGEVLKVDELPDQDGIDELDDDVYFVAQVSDHGNVELYAVVRTDDSVKLESVYGIV